MAWAKDEYLISGGNEPPVKNMAPLLRRRAGFAAKMALEVAYRCLGKKTDVPLVFSSRHGEAARSAELLLELADGAPLSPTSFGLSVHNAVAGLFSIARADHANSAALAAGKSTVESAVIEACGLLSEGAPDVLLVVYDCPLPQVYAGFQDCVEQPYAWAWLMKPASDNFYSLRWAAAENIAQPNGNGLPAGLEILRFQLRGDSSLERLCDKRRWQWMHHAA
ncbi:MAG TPA: beta-ketoacyl synthase chain length factor [Candidatus Binatia bacterium]|nr:beta-ketoacyl synthase chain length factor [Candidatus Binatia bacterium]